MEAAAESTTTAQKAKTPARKANTPKAESSKVDAQPVRGKPKSGRVWKTNKDRFATIKRSLRGKTSSQQLAFRDEIKQIKELSQSIKDTRRRENEEKRLRREENKRRRLENERKNEVVQIIKNPAKLKRMRKKQLRMIEKRDISKLNVV
ncbi:coiled-coil domain-containing protein 86 [Anopheles stephensi]|uniref:Coiled-coil domain-containing protein 86 n=1 Tax=Anopheles stephensi TaxID=30069 RepID=A0A182YDW9_ANOST|nr:coiled-coil domain-containing protein 86 [Anopheles stephensi]